MKYLCDKCGKEVNSDEAQSVKDMTICDDCIEKSRLEFEKWVEDKANKEHEFKRDMEWE